MHSHLFRTSLVLAACLAAVAVACGGGSSKTNPDAKVTKDGSNTPLDGSGSGSGVTGLGQACGSNLPACPSSASMCVAIAISSTASSTSFCTPTCDTGATATTNGSGQFPGSASGYTPAANPADCTSAYSGGSAATPECGLVLAYTPMTEPPADNTQYTGISLGCVVVCGTGNTCPTGMTCNTTVGACFPNN